MEAPEYLTTREVAELLRIKERKVYELSASNDLPHTRATGKLLFPRAALEAWLDSRSAGRVAGSVKSRPNVMLGSHDPVLEWALRESGSGIAALFDGSQSGIDLYASGAGIGAGMHIRDQSTHEWNVPAVASAFADSPVVLIEWSRRQRGLICPRSAAENVREFSDIAGKRVVMRQEGAGTQSLFRQMLKACAMTEADFSSSGTAGTESEAALAVLEDKADIAFGLQSIATQYKLAFIPVIEERFDLLIDRKSYFEPPMQKFWSFCNSDRFSARAAEYEGYDFSGMGKVHYNGP